MNVSAAPASDSHDARSLATRRLPAPLLGPTSAFLIGVAVADLTREQLGWIGLTAHWGSAALFALAGLATLTLVAHLRGWSITPVLILCIAASAGAIRYDAHVRLPADHIAQIAGAEPILTRLAGRIASTPLIDLPQRRNPFLPLAPQPRTRFVLAVTELRTAVPPRPAGGYVRVSIAAECRELRLGDRVQLTGRLSRPVPARNPGQTDWARWNRLQGIHATLFAESDALVQRDAAPQGAYARAANALRTAACAALVSPEAATSDEGRQVLETMVLGQRSAAGRAVNDAFARTGALHLLSVSGFHVGLLGLVAWWSARLLSGSRRTIPPLLTLGALLTYALLAEPNAPIVRATIMGALFCIARLVGRPLSPVNWLAGSALLVVLVDPLELQRPGFQLSFTQMLVLLTVVPALYRRWIHPPPDPLGGAGLYRWQDADTWLAWAGRAVRCTLAGWTLVSLCAWAASLPIVWHHFGRVTPWGGVQSLVITPCASLVVVLGFVTLAVGVIPVVGSAAGALLRPCLNVFNSWLLGLVELAGQLPGTLLDVPPIHGVTCLAILALGGAAAWLWLRSATAARQPAHPDQRPAAAYRRRAKPSVRAAVVFTLGCGAAASIAAIATWRRDVPEATLIVLDVGDGNAVLLAQPGHRGAVFDAGTVHNVDVSQTVVQAARSVGVRALDLLAVSHSDFDHYSGVPGILAALPCREIATHAFFDQDAASVPELRLLVEAMDGSRAPRRVLRSGDRFSLGGASVEVLWPPAGESAPPSDNDRSLVFRIAIGRTSLLLPGDIEGAAMLALLDEHAWGRIELHSDVLLAPHHGGFVASATERFLRAVHPSVIIVSSRTERPKFAAAVRAALGEGCRVVTTGTAGAVTLRIAPDGESALVAMLRGR